MPRAKSTQSIVRMRLFHDAMRNKYRPSSGMCHLVLSEAFDVCRAVGIIPDIGPLECATTSDEKVRSLKQVDRQMFHLLVPVGDRYCPVKTANIADESLAEKFVPMLWELLHEDASEHVDALDRRGMSEDQKSDVLRVVERLQEFCEQIHEQLSASNS